MTTKHPVVAYCHGVLDGSVPASAMIRRAVERHVRDLETGRERGLHFDRQAAEYAVRFFGFLKHSKGEWAGQPFELAPWQQFILWSLFGWKRADGLRRFRTAFIEVPRKNGKTHPAGRDRAVPDDGGRRARSGDLLGGDEAGPGQDHLGRGRPHGEGFAGAVADGDALAELRIRWSWSRRRRSSCRWAPTPTRWTG